MNKQELRVVGASAVGTACAAVTYVSEYAPAKQRSFFVGWLTGTTALAFSLSLGVQLVVESIVGTEAYDAWGWRVPFLISVAPQDVMIRDADGLAPAFDQVTVDAGHAVFAACPDRLARVLTGAL